MDENFRVEKDGITFYVQPEMVAYYADQGYQVYKFVEIPVSEAQAQIISENANPEMEATIESEEVAHG